MANLHYLDCIILVAYFAMLIVIGKITAKHAASGEGYFLAGRKLGTVYQFFLNRKRGRGQRHGKHGQHRV